MTCLLTWASLCLINPANAYASAGVYPHNDNATDGYICHDHWCRGPLAEARVGLEIELTTKLSLDLGYLHRSFIRESEDRGTYGPFVVVTYRPWRE